MIKSYDEFLQSKIRIAQKEGFELSISDISPKLKNHNKLMVKWLVEGGRRACFASFGLHKTVTQLEAIRCTLLKTGGRGLIIAPLGVRAEFSKDAVNILGWDSGPKFIRRIEEAEATGIYITNYETVRDGKLDPRLFQVASLDEASILRGLGGSKTFREFMRLFTGDGGPNGDRRGTECVSYRFVATATPSPNDYIELLAYADFLGVMDVSQAKTRFFKRDSTKADKLTIHAHKEEEFWLWVSSWALFVSKPSDITGDENDDIGYILPDLDIRWHEISSDHSDAGYDKREQYQMYSDVAIGLEGSSKEKRKSLKDRVNKMLELREENVSAHRILWHDLEDERRLIEKSIPSCKSVFGSQKLELREDIVSAFSCGELQELAGKPSMLGSGTNLQKHCSWAIYLGIGFKFNDFIQSIHRLLRFGQTGTVRIDLIYTEAEMEIRKQLERKWKQHNLMVIKMTDIIKQYGNSLPADIEDPINTLTQNPKFNLVKAQQYILNPAWGGNNGSIENPCCTVVARQDKAPLYIVYAELGQIAVPVYDNDTETMIMIKEFMAAHGIVDIKMRMLKISELLQIQGFTKNYKLIGNQTEQKKYIGNAVEVNMAKALAKADYELELLLSA